MNWESIEKKYPQGKRLSVVIKKVESFGAFVDLPEELSGFIPKKELSWIGNVIDARERLSTGQQVEVVVIAVDRTHKNIALSIKIEQENPWPEFCKNHKIGYTITGRVFDIYDKIANVEIERNIEGKINISDIPMSCERMEEALLIGDYVTAKIIKFNSEKHQVILSINALYSDKKKSTQLESGFTLGKTHQDIFDVLKYRLEKQTVRDVGLTSNAKKQIKQILVIDPNKDTGLATSMMLESFGFLTDYALNLQEALEQLNNKIYNFVLSELIVENVDSITIAEKIRNQYPQMPIVIQAAIEDVNEFLPRLESADLHNCILLKPWTIQELVFFINDASEGKLGQEQLDIKSALTSDFIRSLSRPIFDRIESIKTNEDILREIKEHTNSSIALIFEQHLITFETSIPYSIDFEKKLSENDKYYLRYSPVRDVIISNDKILNEKVIGNRWKNLKPVGKFKYVIGLKLDVSGEKGYALFLFSDNNQGFTPESVEDAKISAGIFGAAIARRLIKDIYDKQHNLIITGQISSALVHELNNEQQGLFSYFNVLKNDSIALNAGKFKTNNIQFLARFQRVTDSLLELQTKIHGIHTIFLSLIKGEKIVKVNLTDHLQKFCEAIKYIADQVKVEMVPPHNLVPMCEINISKFNQVITNIILNALYFIPIVRKTDGKIEIEINYFEKEKLPYQVNIKDNGPGIHEVYRSKIFDMFFTTKAGGSGLGLYISKSLVETMGGIIHIKETMRFWGTTFLIELPKKPTMEDS